MIPPPCGRGNDPPRGKPHAAPAPVRRHYLACRLACRWLAGWLKARWKSRCDDTRRSPKSPTRWGWVGILPCWDRYRAACHSHGTAHAPRALLANAAANGENKYRLAVDPPRLGIGVTHGPRCRGQALEFLDRLLGRPAGRRGDVRYGAEPAARARVRLPPLQSGGKKIDRKSVFKMI